LSFEATDWVAIVALYDELLAVQDTPVVALNRAVAVAMADGPAAALPVLDLLVRDPVLADSHRVWAVRGDVNRRSGRVAAALADYDRAIELVSNQAERRYLTHARRQAEEPFDAPVYDDSGIGEWVRRSRAYAEQLPAKKPKQKKG
jgi:RNA polymerase sigma-70 factor, ECF subfamily